MTERRTIERSIVLESIRAVWGVHSDYMFDTRNLRYAIINGVAYDIVDDTQPAREDVNERTDDIRGLP